MKPLKIKNEYGEIIEIKHDADGAIKIRHSDIDPKRWGELHEYAKRMSQPKVKSYMAGKGIDLDKPGAKELLGKMGGYIVIRGESYIINADELSRIHEAVKQAGGVVPNWSSQP